MQLNFMYMCWLEDLKTFKQIKLPDQSKFLPQAICLMYFI